MRKVPWTHLRSNLKFIYFLDVEVAYDMLEDKFYCKNPEDNDDSIRFCDLNDTSKKCLQVHGKKMVLVFSPKFF